MPHLVLLYTPALEQRTDFDVLCRDLANCMLAQRDEHDKPVFPKGGTRVLAYPAAHHAVGDDQPPPGRDYQFLYLNLRMAGGRSEPVKQAAGDALIEVLHQHFDPHLSHDLIGITLQIDEQPPVYDGRISSLHPYFNPG
ncbi:MAG: 5-carboxymethyl-2-hydroxymuconate isomerase [Limnohabitans sp.]|jgi:5-carboxymethyl-2-hydroxymuconate isomerase